MGVRAAVLKAGQNFELWTSLSRFYHEHFPAGPSQDTLAKVNDSRIRLDKVLDKLAADEAEHVRKLAYRLKMALARQTDDSCYELWADLKTELVVSPRVDWRAFLNKPAKTLNWGGRVFDELTPNMIGILERILQKYPVPTTLEELGSYAPEPGQALSKLFRIRRKGKLAAHPVWQILESVSRGSYTLISPERVTQSRSLKKTQQKRSPK